MNEVFTEPQLLSKAAAMLGIKMGERDARCVMKFVVLLREKGTGATLCEVEAIPFEVERELKAEAANAQHLNKMELLPPNGEQSPVKETK